MAGTDEHIVAIMGPTGSGKSKIVDTLTGLNWSGTGLKSVTDQVRSTNLTLRRRNGQPVKIILVDTPGFDDTNKPDSEILEMISNWLAKKYRNGVCLSGMLYLHRITDNRMSGTPHRNLKMFGKLCGGDVEVGKRVVFVTTMWDKFRDKEHLGVQREKQLDDFLRPMRDRGAQLKRSHNTRESAQRLILDLVDPVAPSPTPVLLQEEIVDKNRPLNETEAAQALYTQYQQLLAQHKATIVDLQEAARRSNDPTTLADLEAERARIETDLQKTFEEAKRLKLGWAQRFMGLFRKSKGVDMG